MAPFDHRVELAEVASTILAGAILWEDRS
jgi:hypothetical protein